MSRHPRSKNEHAFYAAMRRTLLESRPTTVEEALMETVPRMLTGTVRRVGYKYVGSNKFVPVRLRTGDKALFWNGNALALSIYDEKHDRTTDYLAMAQRIAVISEAFKAEPLVIDVGAGLSTLALAARYLGFRWQFISIEIDSYANEIAESIIENVTDGPSVLFIYENISEAVSDQTRKSVLKDRILKEANSRPIIISSRQAIRPYYSAEEIERFRDFIANDLQAAAGIHVEYCGYGTKTFEYLSRSVPFQLDVSASIMNSADPFPPLSRSPFKVIERQEIWPHFFGSQFPSFLRWSLPHTATF